MKPSRVSDFDQPDVRSIRSHYRLSQVNFAGMLGIRVSTLRNWEQGKRKPEGAARVLLRVAAKYPETVLDVVHQSYGFLSKIILSFFIISAISCDRFVSKRI
jgi:putative transcriptional regulator